MPTILTIDDDHLYREILLDVFEMHGFQVIEAHNGRLGLQLAKEQRPDLITCDVRMPDLNGYEVLKALRHDPVTAKIPLVFVTSEQTNSARYYAMKFGADGFLPKFCTFEQLMTTIKLQLAPAEQVSVPI